jgi:hypothetical protein
MNSELERIGFADMKEAAEEFERASTRTKAGLRFPRGGVIDPSLRAMIQRLYEMCLSGEMRRLENLEGVFTPQLLAALRAQRLEADSTDPLLNCGQGEPLPAIVDPFVAFESTSTASRPHVHIFNGPGTGDLLIDMLLMRRSGHWVVYDLIFRDSGQFMTGRPFGME